MKIMYYIGLDVHNRTISYWVKDGSGAMRGEGTIPATGSIWTGELQEKEGGVEQTSQHRRKAFILVASCQLTVGLQIRIYLMLKGGLFVARH